MKPIRLYFPYCVLGMVCFGISPLFAQSENELAPGLFVGGIIDDTQDAVDELIEEAFDRFDQSLLLAASEARATVNQASLQLAEVMHLTVDQLDGQQRRLVSDLDSLTKKIAQSIASEAADIVTPLRQDVRLLLSRSPGYVRLRPGYAVRGDEHIEMTLEGTALSQATIQDFRVNATQVEPNIAIQDDSRVTVRIPLGEGPVSELLSLSEDEGDLVEVPIRFALEECWWWGFFCDEGRRFSFVGYILPKKVGTVKAVFVGDIDTEQKKEVTRGPFESPRVKSSVKVRGFPPLPSIRYGRRTDTWAVRPDDGWKIDVESARFDFRRLYRSCSSRRSSARWTQQDEHILRVEVTTATDRKINVTCKTTTTITFTQWRSGRQRHVYKTKPRDIETGGSAEFPLDNETGLTNGRLAYLVVESSLFRGGKRILKDGHKAGGLRVEYDPATQIAYLHARFVRDKT